MSPTWTYSCICGHGSAWICHDILQGGDRPATVSALSPSTGLYGYQGLRPVYWPSLEWRLILKYILYVVI